VELLDCPELAPRPELTVAREILTTYAAPDAAQTRTRDRMVAWIDAHPSDAHKRSCLQGHLTASALLMDSTRTRVLLTLHRKLGKWLQLGGHCDGDANLAGVAWRETLEESGITPAAMSAAPIDVDIHVIPARREEPQHDHLDTRYLMIAPPGARSVISPESIDLRWFTRPEAEAINLDDSVRRLFDIAFR